MNASCGQLLDSFCEIYVGRIPFIPADKSWTPAQIAEVFHDSELHIVLVDSTTHSSLVEVFSRRCIIINLDTVFIEMKFDNTCMACLSEVSRPYSYVIYTSGSCGDAKGILGTEAGILNRCKWMEREFAFQPGDKIAFTTATTFVDSIWQIFGPLVGGVAMVIIPDTILQDADTCIKTLGDTGITHVVSASKYELKQMLMLPIHQ